MWTAIANGPRRDRNENVSRPRRCGSSSACLTGASAANGDDLHDRHVSRDIRARSRAPATARSATVPGGLCGLKRLYDASAPIQPSP